MVDPESTVNNTERAKVFADLAKQKHEGIWKRRQITWRTNFVLWAALGAVAAVLYREAGSLPSGSWNSILVASGIIFVAYAWHWIGAFVSDQNGIAWMHYYEGQAEKHVNVELREGSTFPKRPAQDEGWKHHLWQEWKWSKAHAVFAQIVVTACLMAVALVFIESRTPGDSNRGPQDTVSSQDRLSGDNLRIVLEKLPSAKQSADP